MNVVDQLKEPGKEIQNFRHSTTLSTLITAVVCKKTHTLLTKSRARSSRFCGLFILSGKWGRLCVMFPKKLVVNEAMYAKRSHKSKRDKAGC